MTAYSSGGEDRDFAHHAHCCTHASDTDTAVCSNKPPGSHLDTGRKWDCLERTVGLRTVGQKTIGEDPTYAKGILHQTSNTNRTQAKTDFVQTSTSRRRSNSSFVLDYEVDNERSSACGVTISSEYHLPIVGAVPSPQLCSEWARKSSGRTRRRRRRWSRAIDAC